MSLLLKWFVLGLAAKLGIIMVVIKPPCCSFRSFGEVVLGCFEKSLTGVIPSGFLLNKPDCSGCLVEVSVLGIIEAHCKLSRFLTMSFALVSRCSTWPWLWTSYGKMAIRPVCTPSPETGPANLRPHNLCTDKHMPVRKHQSKRYDKLLAKKQNQYMKRLAFGTIYVYNP